MNAYPDAWGHANSVRMWMNQAATELVAARRGHSSTSKLDEAADSLAHARDAWRDLAFWLELAGQACPPAPAALDASFLRYRRSLASGRWKIDDTVVRERIAELVRDITAVDALIGYLDQTQRAQA